MYVLCARNFVRSVKRCSESPIPLMAVLLSAGHFAALIIGFVALADMAGLALACAYAAIVSVSAFATSAYLPLRWKAQEEARREQIDELKAAAELMREQANAGRQKSLTDVCNAAAKSYDLTRREEEVLGFLLQDYTYAQIEDRLCLSHSTVKSHVRNLYRKMDVNRRESLSRKVGEPNGRRKPSHESADNALKPGQGKP